MKSETGIPVSDVIRLLDDRAPRATAEDWDNVGLLVGDPSWKTEGAVVSIDLTLDAIREAASKKYRLIINHHPCIFPKSRGLGKVVQGSLVFEALQNGIAVAACHTNFDQCAMEVVASVSEGLNIVPRGRLIDHPTGSLLKLVVFVPETHSEAVFQAVCKAGAGHVGNYDSCGFSTSGMGTFRGGDQSRPFFGEPGKLEKIKEVRLETVFPRGIIKPVLKALLDAHPYEEVAYDLYPIEQAPSPKGLIWGLGYGFWGEFTSSKPFSEVAKDVKRLFKLDGFLLTDPPPALVRKIGFAAGKGASFIGAASSVGCDLFITGEVGYHGALDGTRRGMAVMEIGHRESEQFFFNTIENWLTSSGLKILSLNLPTQKIWSA